MFDAIVLVCSFQCFSVVKGLPGSTQILRHGLFLLAPAARSPGSGLRVAPAKNAGLVAANNRSPIIQVMQAEGKGALLPAAGVLGTQRDQDDIQTSPRPWQASFARRGHGNHASGLGHARRRYA